MSVLRLRLGTRRSALARAQSSAFARQLQALHPGLTVELIGIDTRGDRILDRPLSAIEGKEFFTAELDAALIDGRVDLTVHSGKDLALERPAALRLVAMPARANPRDIALFAPGVPQRLAAGGAVIRIGSSSPRRAAFVPAFLERALPGRPQVELVDLRGNVDSRLRRLHQAPGSERYLDGVVLALAGLARLWADAEGQALLAPLVSSLPRMVLPLTQCPAAPAQGALAVECRADDARTIALLAPLDDGATRAAVAVERALLAERGGGCHQRFGATQLPVPRLGTLLYQRAEGGEVQLDWTPADELPPRPRGSTWDGSAVTAPPSQELPDAAARCAAALAQSAALFVSHRRAWPQGLAAPRIPIWVPGDETWFALAERGLWVQGCGEGRGFESLQDLLREPVLALPPAESWLALTHADAVSGWGARRALATYSLGAAATPDESDGLAEAAAIWWHSSAQFERLRHLARADALQACGAGKSALHLRRQGVHNLTVFPSVRQWRQWLQD